MVEVKNKLSANWWWFENHSNNVPRGSPWLRSTLAELDEKTEAMLRLIEEDADSFTKRAEMYYKKRPELVNIVEDFYRAHRSLAERYDQVKFDSGNRLSTPWSSSPVSFSKYRTKLMSNVENSYDSYSESYELEEEESDAESEVDDPEEEKESQVIEKVEEVEEMSNDETNDDELMKLRQEIDRLKEENEVQKEQLMQKDEEKREAIRQLSFAVDLLKEENVMLKGKMTKDSPKKQKSPIEEFSKLKRVLLGKLFNGSPKAMDTGVALTNWYE